MSAAQVKSLYASMPENLAKARRKFGRPLTLSGKILVAHCHDFHCPAEMKNVELEPRDAKAKPGKDVL